MAYHIEKSQQIQDKTDTIFYEGDLRWTTVFDDRKTYINETDATADLYGFGGIVVTDK
jgi:hypothetical protein